MTALHEFIKRSNNIERLRELLTEAGNLNSGDHFGNTPLHIAVLKSEASPEQTEALLLVVSELIHFGANIQKRNDRGKSPLHFAVGCRDYKMIKMLLLSKAQVNQQDFEGFSALHTATSKSTFRGNTYDLDLRVVKLLLKCNPILDLKTKNGKTALMLAVKNKNLPIVRELLKNKAFVSSQDSHGNSAMHHALRIKEVDVNIVFELMKHGGSFKMTNDLGRTPLTSLLRRLVNAPVTELKKALFVFKLYILDGNEFNDLQRQKIEELSNKMKFPFLRYIQSCGEEIKQMREDKLEPDCSVYDIALRGGYYSVAEKTHFPIEVFEKVLKKLISKEYPYYRDVIAEGICSPYINKEFSEWGNITEMDNKLFEFDAFYLVSSYLSNAEMLNMMVACTGAWRRYWYLPRFTYSTRCIMS